MPILAYPAALPAPQPGSFAPRARRAVSSIEGPLQQRARQRDAAGLSSQYTYVYTPDEMEAWRAWYRDTLRNGQRWFVHRLPGPSGMVPRVVRYLAAPQQLRGAGIYEVRAQFEQRGRSRLPEAEPDVSSVLLLHMDGVHGGTTFVDSSANPKSVSVVGPGCITSTANPKFGSAAATGFSFSSAIAVENHGDLALGLSDFTIEGWCFPTDIDDGNFQFLRHGDSPTHRQFDIYSASGSGRWQVYFYPASGTTGEYISFTTSAETAFSAGAYHHFAVVRSDDVIAAYINGVPAGAMVFVEPVKSPTGPLYVGNYGGLAQPFPGYLDEIRITRQAVYTGPFDPPSGPFVS